MGRGWAHSKRQKTKADEAREVLSNLVFSHVPVIAFNFQQKVRPAAKRAGRLVILAAPAEQQAAVCDRRSTRRWWCGGC